MAKRQYNKHNNTMKHFLIITLLVMTKLTFGQSNSEKDTLTTNPNFSDNQIRKKIP